jgi:hypothetical protein
MSDKCISHFKMLWSVSRTYYGEVALTSPIFFVLFYLLQVNSRVIPMSLTVTLGDGRVIQIVVKAGKNDPSE